VTIGRLVAWMMIWMSGWALFFVRPAGHSTAGAVLLLAVSPLVMVTPREWRIRPLRRGGIAVAGLVALFLLLVFVLPPSYTWQFPGDPALRTGLTVVAAGVAAMGIAITSRRFARDHAGAW
jgi:hypothetical protein